MTTKLRRRELDGEVGSADAAARRLEHLGCRLSRQISSFSAQSFDLLEKARCCSERSGEVFLFADAERLRFGNVLDAATQFLDLIFVNLLTVQQSDAASAHEHDALLDTPDGLSCGFLARLALPARRFTDVFSGKDASDVSLMQRGEGIPCVLIGTASAFALLKLAHLLVEPIGTLFQLPILRGREALL